MAMLAVAYTERVPTDEQEPELLSASDAESPKKCTHLRLGVAVIGIACLSVAAAAYVVVGRGNALEMEAAPVNSAWALLESRELAETMKGNYLKFNPDLKKTGDLLEKVQGSMNKITKHIKETEPKVFEQLNQLELSDDQKQSVLKVVGNMGDDRVQKIGREIGRIAKDSKTNNGFSQETMKRKLAEAFEQNKTKLADLRNELVPAPLRKMVDKNWDLTLDAEKMRLIRNSRDSWDVEVSMDKPTSRRLIDEWGSDTSSSGTDISETAPGSELTSHSMDGMGSKFEAGLGLCAGMLEQARVALDQIDFVGESFDVDMKIPYWAKSMVGGLDFVSELSDCVMRANDGNEKGDANQVKMMMCPVKYASAATDFLESVDNVMGMSNGHFSLFGDDTTTMPYAAYPPQAIQQQQFKQYQPQPQYQQPQPYPQQQAYPQQEYAPPPTQPQGYAPQGSGSLYR